MRLINIHVTIRVRTLAVLSLLFQLTFVALVITNVNPLLRQITGFLCLAFIPGILVLKILRIKLSLNTALLAIGLSISLITFVVTSFNNLSHFLGFKKPISEMPLLLVTTLFTIPLCLICYIRSGDHSDDLHIRFDLFSALSLWLIPLSLYGSYRLISYDSNITILLLYTIIPILLIIVVVFKKITKDAYPFIILIMSVSLLCPRLLAMTSAGETIMPGVVSKQGKWNPNIPHLHNSLLINTIFHPTFYILCGFRNVVDELKVANLLFYSLVPVALYQIFRKRVNEDSAFIASFLFMSHHWFLTSGIPRNNFAQLFLSLIFLSAFSLEVKPMIKSLFAMIFSLSLIVSHYGTSYLFMLSLIVVLVLRILCDRYNEAQQERNLLLSSYNFTLFYVTGILAYYIYIANSVSFVTFVEFFKYFLDNLNGIFSPQGSHAIGSLVKDYNAISIEILKYLTIFILAVITIGIVTSFYIWLKRREKFDEYLFFSITFLGILGSTLLPIGGTFDTMRILHITLILLAPYFIIGIKATLEKIKNIKNPDKCIVLSTLIIITFFLLNSGLIADVITKDYSPNSLINKEMIMRGSNMQAKFYLYEQGYRPRYDVEGSEWVRKYASVDTVIYCDYIGWRVLEMSKYGQLPEEIAKQLPRRIILNKNSKLRGLSYVFLAYHNNIERIIFIRELMEIRYFNAELLIKVLEKNNKIYDNGGSTVFLITEGMR